MELELIPDHPDRLSGKLGEEERRPDQVDGLNHLDGLCASFCLRAVDHECEFQSEPDHDRCEPECDHDPAQPEQNAAGTGFHLIFDARFVPRAREPDHAPAQGDRRGPGGTGRAAQRLEADFSAIGGGDLDGPRNPSPSRASRSASLAESASGAPSTSALPLIVPAGLSVPIACAASSEALCRSRVARSIVCKREQPDHEQDDGNTNRDGRGEFRLHETRRSRARADTRLSHSSGRPAARQAPGHPPGLIV